MKAQVILDQMSPFALLADKNAMSPVYRVLCFYAGGVQAVSPYAALDLNIDIGVTETFYIDSGPFFAVLRSVPSAQELELKVQEGALHWKCGTAKGRLALTTVLEWPDFPAMIDAENWFKPDKEFTNSLQLGAISCGTPAMASAGLYGVALDGRTAGILQSYSCDNETISWYKYATDLPITTGVVTLSPPAAKLLQVLIDYHATEVFVQTDATSVNITTGNITAVIKQIPAFKRDVSATIEKYISAEIMATLPEDRVKSFARRTSALVENRQNAKVLLGVSESTLTLAFADSMASSEEYYLVEELEGVAELGPVLVDASRLVNVLQHADKVAFDHVERGVLVFYSKDNNFMHILSGTKPE